MLSRRQFQFGGCAAALLGHKALAATPPAIFGCTANTEQALVLLDTADPQQFRSGTILPSSGDRKLDYALAQTLSFLTDKFGVLPSFGFIEEPNGPNAFALPIARLPERDGTVLFGRRLLNICLKLPEAPDAAIGCTCAHEFGHIVQYKHGLKQILMRGQVNVRQVELHADFLAGYFAGIRKLKRSDFPAAVFATTQYMVGDNDFGSPLHHGTPKERAAAIVRGFEVAFRDHLPLDSAVSAGIEYVTRI